MTEAGTLEPPGRARPVRLVLRFLIAAVLVVTGLGKLLDVRGFAGVLESYRALPDFLVFPVAAGVPVAELALGTWLFSGRRLLSAALAALAMHLAYTAWSASAVLRGLRLPNCGCFGVFLPRPLGWSTVVEDLVMTGLCGALAAVAPRARRA